MKIVVVDDHPLVKMGVEMIASVEEDIEVVGSASTGVEAVKLVQSCSPDVVLLDLRLNGEHGLDAARKIRQCRPEVKIIILTSYAPEGEITQAVSMGVEGYILKEALPEELIGALRLVYRGKKYFDPVVVHYALGRSDNDKKDVYKLTRREKEVLGALAQGLSNKEIAAELVISEHTVKKHIGQILEKLELKDRTQAALYAVSRKMGRNFEGFDLKTEEISLYYKEYS